MAGNNHTALIKLNIVPRDELLNKKIKSFWEVAIYNQAVLKCLDSRHT